MAHTLVDALLATAIIVVWQRLYGAEETGWMSALLRVLGFVPAVVHMAWAQVALAQGTNALQAENVKSWRLAVGGFVCVATIGLASAVAIDLEWLEPKWRGMASYIGPLVFWQGSACLSAAFSHRPFHAHSAQKYSWICMVLALLQSSVLLGPFYFDLDVDAGQHITIVALFSGLGLLGLTRWITQLR
jgi:uncharacterized membrane protein YqaE (UPF0057 family)